MQRVIATVDASDVAAYGAGALLRVERGPTWVEFATVTLVAGETIVLDNIGTDASTYRTRYSTAAPAVAGDYSDYSPTKAAAAVGGLLTVAQFREHVTTTLSDSALQTLLDASEAAIVAAVGATGEVTEYLSAHAFYGDALHRITVARQIGTIASVTEYSGSVATVLDATDYRASGYVLSRLPHGTHSQWAWSHRVAVVYTPADDTSERERVQLELVKLDLNAQPGLAAQSVEGFGETYNSNSVMNYEIERALILATLGGSGGGMVVVGDEY